MKILALLICIFSSLSLFGQGISKVVPARPNPPRLVNDLANVLTADQEHALEQKLLNYSDSTTTQIAIVTMETTGDYEIDEVALQILRDWGVGQKQKDNGLVILAAMADRKVWISTGYGLEGAVPDITAKSIIDNDITPAFREQNYFRGFDEATNSIFRAAAGEYTAPPGYSSRKSKGSGGISIGKIILAFIIIMFLMNRMGGGGKGGGYMSRRGYRGFGGGPVFLPGGYGGGGFGGGGGGFGGGGFGGFGGGGGGGGGAGGSW